MLFLSFIICLSMMFLTPLYAGARFWPSFRHSLKLYRTRSTMYNSTMQETFPISSYLSKNITFNINNSDTEQFEPTSSQELALTKFNVITQMPWNALHGPFLIKVAIRNNLFSLEPSLLSHFTSNSEITSLMDFTSMMHSAAHDARCISILLELEGLHELSYAHLTELIRAIRYFRQSGKMIVAFTPVLSEKELLIGSACTYHFMGPNSNPILLTGFSMSNVFIRGMMDIIGVETQAEVLGPYKSSPDMFLRPTMSDSQQETLRSLVMDTSNFWLRKVAEARDVSVASLAALWSRSNLTAYELESMGIISGNNVTSSPIYIMF
jgi:hypothetical protein